MTTEDLDAFEKLANFALPSLTVQAMVNAECRAAVPALVVEVRRLRDALNEKEGDMHLRIRQGYDKTVADSWRSHCARIEQERDAARVQVERLNVECASAYRRGVEQAIRSVEGEATPSALRQAERLRSMLLDDGACRDLVLEIKCKQAYRRGVEAMRAGAIEIARKRADLSVSSDTDAAWCRSAQCIVDELLDLAAPEDKR